MMAPFVPIGIINPSVVKIVDIAGQEHLVTIIQRQTGFIARSIFTDEPARSLVSANHAVQRLLHIINENHPKQFDYMDSRKQRKLLAWIRLYWHKGKKGNTKRWSSYQLKEVVERAIGFDVSNGELKGAMQAAGLAPVKESLEYDITWCFDLERNPQLWSFLWRLINHGVNTKLDALFNPPSEWGLPYGSEQFTAYNSTIVETPAIIESYPLAPVYALSGPNPNNG